MEIFILPKEFTILVTMKPMQGLLGKRYSWDSRFDVDTEDNNGINLFWITHPTKYLGALSKRDSKMMSWDNPSFYL